ncbi:50S ribosomal protein L3 [candidate division WWE3 bacterium CG_4_10_14_0_2_um_filter_42_8]|uniref:Large ribosomal subunit protein uL3 n=1 Tax=candidate division WWE3 bacterium CG_4_10_14_0_2_um_filter_42_8 TaxID=1975074 RepID=A0A2M7TCI7_UNCKA|nr:MAG: 50S ribosomal protein L3 [candidate division WWE3 bacterium CG_4_10_14_0_2_um_filter_42_8]
MIEGLIGRKIEMSQVFTEEGAAVPVTTLEVGPCIVTQVKTQEKDGYEVCQVGFGNLKPKLLKKPQMGHFKNIKQKPRFLAEFKMIKEGDVKVGQKIHLTEVFQVGEEVCVMGRSKGKGFAGVVKRWGFAGGPKTHGQSDRLRAPGSIGSTTTPGRVYKGKKMAGRMGGKRVTTKGLKVIAIDDKNNLLSISGAVPGYRNAIVYLKKQ